MGFCIYLRYPVTEFYVSIHTFHEIIPADHDKRYEKETVVIDDKNIEIMLKSLATKKDKSFEDEVGDFTHKDIEDYVEEMMYQPKYAPLVYRDLTKVTS